MRAFQRSLVLLNTLTPTVVLLFTAVWISTLGLSRCIGGLTPRTYFTLVSSSKMVVMSEFLFRVLSSSFDLLPHTLSCLRAAACRRWIVYLTINTSLYSDKYLEIQHVRTVCMIRCPFECRV